MRFIIYNILMVVLTTHLTAQTRYYVHATATGTNDGSSWVNAFTDLQSALVLADAGDSVWVAEGLYKPTSGADRVLTFAPRSGVVLLGGFAGTESIVAERDWAAHPVTLSGDIGVQGDSLDNSYNVVYLQSPDSSTVVDGFVIQHGFASFTGGPLEVDSRKCGGGMYINGINSEAYATVQNCTFRYNSSSSFGGGIAIAGIGIGSVAPIIENCLFEHNRSNYGGAIARFGGSWVDRRDFVNCIFRNNMANIEAGGIYYRDTERTDRLDIVGSEFLRNRSIIGGPAVLLNADRINGARVNISGCSFTENTLNYVSPNNQSELDAAVVMQGYDYYSMKELVIEECRFENNNFSPAFSTYRDVFVEYPLSILPNITVKFDKNTIINSSIDTNELYILSVKMNIRNIAYTSVSNNNFLSDKESIFFLGNSHKLKLSNNIINNINIKFLVRDSLLTDHNTLTQNGGIFSDLKGTTPFISISNIVKTEWF
jgi:hypothetical protein